MEDISALGAPHCILLFVSLASESNIGALRQLYESRKDILTLELVLRLLLTFLPESLDPSAYTAFLRDISSGPADNVEHHSKTATVVDVNPVKDLSIAQAQKRLRKLHLLSLSPSSNLPHDTSDFLTLFLIKRAQLIDSETGILTNIPRLLTPFLEDSPYLKTWYISTVLPFFRLSQEYYPSHDSTSMTVDEFEMFDERTGVERLLFKTQESLHTGNASSEIVGRDLRGLVGPWVYGASQRKRRRVLSQSASKVETNQSDEDVAVNETGPWEQTFNWIIDESAQYSTVAVKVFDGWNGPSDVDFGVARPTETQQNDNSALDAFCQTGVTTLFVSDFASAETIRGAFSILSRLADIKDYAIPGILSLDTTTISLPPPPVAESYPNLALLLQTESLRQRDNMFTSPTPENFTLIYGLIECAFLLNHFQHDLSILKVARLLYLSDQSEQLDVLQKIIESLVRGPKLDEKDWLLSRQRLLWLHHWTGNDSEQLNRGWGILGRVPKLVIEKEIFKAFCQSNQLSLATRVYFQSEQTRPIPTAELESLVIGLFFDNYDSASNGNRTRGAMKKSSDLLIAFKDHFRQSYRLSRCQALLSATHSLSFYSLTLQHGVPLRPASIRIYEDPVSLISKVLDQNPKSYTKLDDLINIGHNMVIAEAEDGNPNKYIQSLTPDEDESRILHAEHRVIGMTIEAALAEEDFETAYSYVVNRLNISSHDPSAEDDISWRAAFQAGRHRSVPQSQTSQDTTSVVRRLEQRMELLSHALQLAPSAALPEILGAWRKCEEELLTLLKQESEAEQDFDDSADSRTVSHIPGGFTVSDQSFMIQPRRKEIGRGAVEEAPMGLFDVARGAAAAFGKSTGGALRASKNRVIGSSSIQAAPTDASSSLQSPLVSGEGERVRKRDMVANAMSSGLASGIGWVLGATPIQHDSNKL